MAWTEKMVEDLKIMWKQGLTTGEIGKRLGVSKNSIVGKVHRQQLDARPSPIKKKDRGTGKCGSCRNRRNQTGSRQSQNRKENRTAGRKTCRRSSACCRKTGSRSEKHCRRRQTDRP